MINSTAKKNNQCTIRKDMKTRIRNRNIKEKKIKLYKTDNRDKIKMSKN